MVRKKLIRKAVIDLGTNTFNLLIVDLGDKSFELVHAEKEGVALGMGGINDGIIAPEAFNRGLTALSRFMDKCKSLGVKEVTAIGTSALRSAANASEFLSAALELGIHIEIVSGMREAELIYKGVKWSYNFKTPGVIMDIGGGSTEFIFADSNGMTDIVSMNIGVSRIYQQFECSDPVSEDDILMIENWLEERADGFFDGKNSDLLIGASGSFETFYELIHEEPFPEKVKSVEVPFDELMESLEMIIRSTQKDRDKNPFIIPIRKKMAPIAAIKTRWVIQKLNVKRVMISPFSLKEGAI